MAKQTLLITAFEPFEGRRRNASQEALLQVARDYSSARFNLVPLYLPVVMLEAASRICRILDEFRPPCLLSLGEANRDTICLEQTAYNERRYRIPDNAGNLVEGQLIEPDGPPHYPATLPLADMLAALAAAEIPARLSDDPGRYLCNEVMYSSLHHIMRHNLPTRAGFIHVPLLLEENNAGSPVSGVNSEEPRILQRGSFKGFSQVGVQPPHPQHPRETAARALLVMLSVLEMTV
jgi:pyroglutamyl-peptidase